VARRDLLPSEPDHPRAGQWYYKLQLGPLEHKLPPIVSTRWRRVTFIVTSGDRFMQAVEINDLFEHRSSLGISLARPTACASRQRMCWIFVCERSTPGCVRLKPDFCLSDLLGFVVMFHSYDYISLFVPFVHVSVSLDNLFQWKASINDRFYLPRLNEFFEEDQIFGFWRWSPTY
jgi:hypothetical protein